MKETKPSLAAIASTQDEIDDLLQRADKGDASTIPKLREFLADAALLDIAGNLARQVQDAVIKSGGGKSLLYAEGVALKMEKLRNELGGANATPLERLLVERVVLCWLTLHDAEARFALAKELTLRQGAFWQDRIDRAHRRYLSAMKTLATVRKLALPVLQVNIAKRQTNIAGVPPTEGC